MYSREPGLCFEVLRPREMLTNFLGDAAEISDQTESFTLDAEPQHNSILISNESAVPARFAMRFNGNFSVNTGDLVEQIRDFQVAGKPDAPDYEKAYHFMLKYHAHDFPVTHKFYMHAPSLYVNSFGVGWCGDVAGALKEIWHEMGYESRLWYLNGHVVSEVFTGERWEMYDADLRVVYYNHETGDVAGVEELAENPHFIYSPLERFPNPNGTKVNHSKRTASFYSTTENNWICERCTENLPDQDLFFQIPPGGSLEVGELSPHRSFTNPEIDVADFGILTVTIPRNSIGSLDIPLALFDVTGSNKDNIDIGARTFSPGSDEVFDYFNEEKRGEFEVPGKRLEPISYSNNSEPVQVHYLVNKELTELLDENVIEISHVGRATSLKVELVGPSSFDVLAGDVNGDGRADIIQHLPDGSWQVTVVGSEDNDVATQPNESPYAAQTAIETPNVIDINPDAQPPTSADETLGTTSIWTKWSTEREWTDIQVADFNGDGLDDIAGRDNNGRWWVAESTGTSFRNSRWATWTPGIEWLDVSVGDFNGDGRADIAGRAETNASWWIAISEGDSFRNEPWGRWTPDIEWHAAVGDYNGDGLSDIAGRAGTDGTWWISESDGERFLNSYWGRFKATVSWDNIGVGDFNGDGLSDIIARDSSDGTLWVARSTGTSFENSFFGNFSSRFEWHDISVADVNGDGLDDLVGRIGLNGSWWVARSDGNRSQSHYWRAIWEVDTEWLVGPIADFDGDGKVDLIRVNMGTWPSQAL